MPEIARQHKLMVFSDEIYDKILYDGAVHISTASLAPDLLCLTFNGLSKSYRVAGFRSGWMAVSGPKRTRPATSRASTCWPTCGCAPTCPRSTRSRPRWAAGRASMTWCCRGGRLLEQRDTDLGTAQRIPGVTCVKPMGALYAFPRIDPKVCPIHDDEQFVLDLLLPEKIMVVHGTGFNWPWPDHFRVVTLPPAQELAEACTRIGAFLDGYSQP